MLREKKFEAKVLLDIFEAQEFILFATAVRKFKPKRGQQLQP